MRPVHTFLFLFLPAFSAVTFAQKNNAAVIDTLLAQSGRLMETHTDSALHLAFKAAELSQKNADPIRIVRSYQKISDAYNQSDDVDLNISFAQKAFDASSSVSDETLKAQTTLDLGRAFFRKGFYDQANVLFRKAKTASDQLGNDDLNYSTSNSLGFSFLISNYKNTDSAEYYYNIAMQIAEKQKDSIKIARSLINISNVYSIKKKWDDQLVYIYKALEIFTRKNHLDGMTLAYKSIGDVYYYKNETAKAIEFYLKEYEYAQKMKSNNNIAYAACDLAYMYAVDKKYGLLDQYAKEAKAAAEHTGSFPALKYVGGWLSEAYEMTGNTKSALEFYKLYSNAKDSINDRERIEKSSRAEAQSGFDAKVEQLKIEEAKRQAITNEKEQHQRLIRNILVGGFLLAMILLFIAYRSYVQKKKANVIISKQKQEVEIQKLNIEEKNKQITDSINYAKFIQRSILPDPNEIMKVFPESFGLYKPKDVVSGDFYWFARHGTISMIAAADCTGHGVPGALMSMLGNDKLHYAVNSNITDPGAILSFVNEGVKTTLKQSEDQKSSQDGMDIALCCFDLSKNLLKFSGANRPLWHIRNGVLTEYKPTKSAIGGSTETSQKFTEHEITLEKGDTIYISTDGFADQFGGDKGKKLMTKNLKDLLLAIQNVPIKDQENILDEKLKQWQGEFEQVDDILLIGIRI